MSIVIESAIGDENILYPSMEQPENDALNDSRDVSKDDSNSNSNAMMEEQMSSSNDQVEDFPQKPQHIFVMDRESSLGKREHDSVVDRRASESSVSESSAASPRRHARSYGKKKQKLSARQRKRRLERSFGSDFKPGTIRHRLNFLQHSFGDQLALIEESLPETFHRNMNLEVFIRNKMEQHEQHTNTSTDKVSMRRSPSFRRSPERQRKSSLKEMPGIKESAQEQTEQPEMAEIMTFAPRETPHFDSSASELEISDRSPAGHFSHAVDRSAREWRLSKFLEESPPPSPERKAITVEVPVVAALPEVPSLNESDVPALATVEDAAVVAIPESSTAVEEVETAPAPSNAPVSSFSMVSATGMVETVNTTPIKAPKEAPFDDEPVVDSPVTEEAATPAPLAQEAAAEQMPVTKEPQVVEPATEDALEEVTATPKETEESAMPAVTEEVPKTEEPATPDVAAAEVDALEYESEHDIAVAGNDDGEVMEASSSSMPDLVPASAVEPVVASSDDTVEAPAESVHEGVASEAEAPVMEASTSSMPDLIPASSVETVETPSEDVVEAPAEPLQEGVASEPEAPTETIQEGVASEPEAPTDSVDEGVANEPQTAVVDIPAEPVQEGVTSEPEGPAKIIQEGVASESQTAQEGVVDTPAESIHEGVPSEPQTAHEGAAETPAEPAQEEDPVSVQVKESASQIPDVGEDTPSRGESPESQAKEAVQVAPEAKIEAPIVVMSETEGVVSEPEPLVVETPKSPPQEDPAVPMRDGVAQEESSNDNKVPTMSIQTKSAPTDDLAGPSTPVGDQSVSSASTTIMESPKTLDAVEQARMEQATPVKAVASEAATPPTPDAVERARLEQQTPVKRKHDEDATCDDAASKQPKAETSDKADATDATDENKDSQNCPSPSSVMDTELGDGEGKVKKQCALKENRKLRFADELGKPLTKEHIIEREANYASRIVVMLLSPRDRKFEFLHAEYPLDESTTVQVLLEQVPLLATNDAFRTKKFNALLQTETSRQLDNALALQDYCFKESEIVLGIPDDFTVANMTKMAVPLLLNKKLMKTVKQAIRKGRGLKTVQSGVEWRK
ncbi:MAG: hypothetical protein SGBAC_006105 [Bacillariaceae sp.]